MLFRSDSAPCPPCYSAIVSYMQNRRNIYPIIAWIIVACWMTAMFLFSATPADTSQAESGFLANIVVTWIHPDYAQMPADVQYEVLHQCDHVIRKCAHALEYLLLGILVQVALNATRLRGSKQSSHARPSLIAATSLAICVLYATTDEIHQDRKSVV